MHMKQERLRTNHENRETVTAIVLRISSWKIVLRNDVEISATEFMDQQRFFQLDLDFLFYRVGIERI